MIERGEGRNLLCCLEIKVTKIRPKGEKCMKKYEIMFILSAELDEASRNAEIESLKNVLVSNGANVLEVNEWGVRELAYEIKAQKRGYYVVVTLEAADDAATREFDRVSKINTKVIRHLIVRLEK